VGAKLHLSADRKAGAGEMRGENTGILEAQVHIIGTTRYPKVPTRIRRRR
jgi:hypothetical protein